MPALAETPLDKPEAETSLERCERLPHLCNLETGNTAAPVRAFGPRTYGTPEDFFAAHPECSAVEDGCFKCWKADDAIECTPAAFVCVSREFACSL